MKFFKNTFNKKQKIEDTPKSDNKPSAPLAKYNFKPKPKKKKGLRRFL